MNRRYSFFASLPAAGTSDRGFRSLSAVRFILATFAGVGFAAHLLSAQVLTVDTSGKSAASTGVPIDRRYAQIEPTHVTLSKVELDTRARLDLIRQMQSEQGFAMRPLPFGHKGLTLNANGPLEPAGEAYLNMAVKEGTAVKPGDRVVITNIKIERARIVFDLNGGPDLKHRILSRIQVSSGPYWNPIVRNEETGQLGARLALAFQGHVPQLSGNTAKALLAPLISFDVKSPVQAFTDTLPAKLKDAILNHHVMVGMSTEMVLFAKGQPETKTREMDGPMPFEEWIYGKPPKDVEFVRINGNRVIRIEVAKTGERPVVFTQDEVEGMMRPDGTPLMPEAQNQHTVQMGDVERDPNTRSAIAAPTLANPGEKLPNDNGSGTMKPVRFPEKKPAPQPGANPDGVPDLPQPSASPPAAGDVSQPVPAKEQPPAS